MFFVYFDISLMQFMHARHRYERSMRFLYFLYELLLSIPIAIWDLITRRPKCVRGKIVVVTGGAQGLGKEVAHIFATQLGAKVAILDINQNLNEATANEINEDAGEAYAFRCDVTDPARMRDVASKIEKHPRLGIPDILICNAGVIYCASVEDLTDDQIKKTVDINLLGYFWTIRAFLTQMKRKGSGHIAAVSSVAGHMGNELFSAYSATKFGVRGLMESLQTELLYEKSPLKTTTIYPFFTQTNLLNDYKITTGVPALLPILSIEETSGAIVEGVLNEYPHVYVPRFISILCTYLKGSMWDRGLPPTYRFLDVKCRKVNDKHRKLSS